GKTDCSVCHSSNGVFCRACLKVRYGEEIEEVRENKEWMCPHCIEDKGINPYWICNSSICLRKRKMSPTGIAIHKGGVTFIDEQKFIIRSDQKMKRACVEHLTCRLNASHKPI
ncbi:cell division cycle-associated 7-like protein, partial [Trifolium pratense]